MQTRQKKNDEIKTLQVQDTLMVYYFSSVYCTLKAKVAAEAKELDENKAKHRELTQNLRDGLNDLRDWQR